MKHAIADVAIPEYAGVTFAATPVPTRFFGPGDTVEGPTMPPHTSIERHLAETGVQEILKVHASNVRATVSVAFAV